MFAPKIDYTNVNCGLCGAQTCAAFAEDVGGGKATPQDCVLLSLDRIRKLMAEYDVEDLVHNKENDDEKKIE